MEGSEIYPSKDPMFKLEQEMKIRGFFKQTIKAYFYYNKELLKFANKIACFFDYFIVKYS